MGTYAALENRSPAAASVPATAPSAAPSSPNQAEPSSPREEIGGTVMEVIQVPSYTYLRLEQADSEELWVAVSKAAVHEGQIVQLARAERMENFSSKQLDRTFPVIYFGALAAEGSNRDDSDPQSAANPHAAPPGMRSDRGNLANMVKVIPAEKAEGEGGHRVAELFAQKDKLSGSKIQVRATVVQVTMNVMGTNFVHVRDGSGTVEKKNHDLVLKVAAQPPNVGEQALFEGTVQTEVDLGAGYTYAVLIEDASVIGK